jgi:hypothetical protein
MFLDCLRIDRVLSIKESLITVFFEYSGQVEKIENDSLKMAVQMLN